MTTFEYHIEKTTISLWSGKDKTDIHDLLSRAGRDGNLLMSSLKQLLAPLLGIISPLKNH